MCVYQAIAALVLSATIHSAVGEETDGPRPLGADEAVRGWMILSDSLEDGLRVIERAADYDINHLQISHEVIHDLKHVRNDRRREISNALTRAAHEAGITEVVLWDRAFYSWGHYPERFRVGPRNRLNLDDPEFWQWFQDDYREMLDLVPDIQGIVLTFIETRTRIERQHSETMTSNQEKIAAVVNAIAEVVIAERGLNLYARTFAYDDAEYENIVGAIELFEYPQIKLMMKETPHDFKLTHPNDRFAGAIPLPTIMEFDTGQEFNGQGLIANTWPQYILGRWNDFLSRDHIVGYVARTDRYGHTRVIDTPAEINLLALHRRLSDEDVDAEQITREFIAEHYGEAAYPFVAPAFANAFDIVAATLYTLGTNTADHSRMDYDPYPSSYARHVSGKWFDPPVVHVGHGVDRAFHYWTDVVDRLAPAWVKKAGVQHNEIPQVVANAWLTPRERMNEEYLRYVVQEKDYAVDLAKQSLASIAAGREVLAEDDYAQLKAYFERTLITARLHRATAAAYWGFRVWCRGGEHRSDWVTETTKQGLLAMRSIAEEIRAYPHPPAQGGQWNWLEDADAADRYWRWIVDEGWPEKIRGTPTAMGGQRFPVIADD
ncbi:MAG: hypothetical protein EA401_02420 [Planctomycetota bacterium]|nr:MAG: hypothetical protein EA401_02420 [Planctomycetota bacterium]